MRLKDYFAGRSLALRSKLSAEVVAERINHSVVSPLLPFSSGVTGGVWLGILRLRYRTSIFEYNAKPILAGRIFEDLNGSIIDLKYRAPLWVYAFFIVWYTVLALVVGILTVNVFSPGVSETQMIMGFAITLILLGAPIGLHALGTQSSEEEFENLINFLVEHAEATF